MAEELSMQDMDDIDQPRNGSLCDALDRTLQTGAVLKAELTISVADVDLIYINLAALVASVDTAKKMINPPANLLQRPRVTVQQEAP